MLKRFSLLLATVALLACSSPIPEIRSEAPRLGLLSQTPTTHRIWFVGDSITRGNGSQYTPATAFLGGFRPYVFNQLRALGYNATSIGSVYTADSEGDSLTQPAITVAQASAITLGVVPLSWPQTGYGWSDYAHDGHNGATATTTGSAFAGYAASVGATANDLGILIIGSNDTSSFTGADCAAHLATLLGQIASATSCPFIVSTIPPQFSPRTGGTITHQTDYNALVASTVASAGSQFTYGDLCAGMVAGDISPYDGIHTMPSGNKRMADNIVAALVSRWGSPDALPKPRRFTPRSTTAVLGLLGSGSHVNLAATPAITPATDSFWVALWHMPTLNSRDGNTRGLFSLTASNFNLGLTVFDFNSQEQSYVNGGGYTIATHDDKFFRWNRHVIVADRALLQMRYYIDGVLVRTSIPAGWTFPAGQALRIGGGIDGTTSTTFPGYYSDFQIGRGVVPSIFDVERDYYEGIQMPGAVCRYKLNEGTGTNAADTLAIGPTGTITSGTWATSPLPPFQPRP